MQPFAILCAKHQSASGGEKSGMRCRSCMTVNPIGNRFCEDCGAQLHLACPKCGHDVALSARFCGTCGTGLAAAPAAGPATGREPAPKWGELKQATVLFADIVGSTELVAHLDPEEAMGRLRPAILRMRHSVERFGGTVTRTLGDGVMALFGVPRTLEGHALLACQAALHMQKAFSQSADGLAIRIGLHSGQVASDPEDSEDGRGGGAHGVTIHVASRVIALAQPGGTCLTQACVTAAGPACEFRTLGAHTLRGIPKPVHINALLGVRAASPRRAAAPAELTTFRGRSHELARLANALESTLHGDARVLGIMGEPGAGKSRLCQEFAGLCAGRGIPLFEVRAQLYGHALPLQPILELFRTHYFGIVPTDSAAAARVRIAHSVETQQLPASDLAVLYEFFGVADPASPPLALGPKARHLRLLALLRDLVRQQADAERVILIEDLHWLDDASEEFISALVEAVAGTRTLLLLNYRPSYRCPWAQDGRFEQVHLGELPPAEMDALVAELLAPAAAPPGIRELVSRRSGGNPFFAEELVRTLDESRLLGSEAGLPEGGLDAVERALPATVEAVVGARLDRVGEPEKTLLQMCAIIGKEIPLAVLEHVASPIAAQIREGLDGLCGAGLILPTEGGQRFAFRHPLIQEVAYNTQLKVRRSEVHASVAIAMELYYREQLDEYAGLIAYHFEAAHQNLEAAGYTARAASWIASTDSARAITGWRKVRALLGDQPRSAEVDRLNVLACGKIAWLSWREGLPMAEVMQYIHEARMIAGSADAQVLRLLLFLEGRMLQANGGPVDRYVELVQQAMTLLEPDAPTGSKVLLNTALSQAYGWAGMFTHALEASDAALAGAEAVDRFEEDFIGYSLRQWSLVLRGRLLTRTGDLAGAAACLHQVTRLTLHQVDPVLLQIAHYGLAEVACLADDIDAARRHADTVARIAERQGNSYLTVFAHACAALVAHVRRDFAAAAAGFRSALDGVRRDNVAREFETELLVRLAESHYALRDMESAETLCREAAELSHGRNNRHQHVRALMIASAIVGAKAGADADEAAALLAQARELVRATGASALPFQVRDLPEIVLQ